MPSVSSVVIQSATVHRVISRGGSATAVSRLGLCVPFVLLVACVGCGANSGTSTPAQPAASSAAAAASAPDIAANGVTAYFHEQLIANGEDVQSDFGSALLTLGLNPRDLQQDTPEHAYQTAKQKLDELKDELLKRDLTRALFGAAQAPAR